MHRPSIILHALVAAFALAACEADDPTFVDGGLDADVTAPETRLTVAPAAFSNQVPARFELASDRAGTFACKLDGGVAVACTSPLLVTVADGPHELEVTATSTSGVADPTPSRHAWVVDTVAPDTSFQQAPAALDNSVTTRFEFTSTEEATFTCQLDGGAAAPCTSPAEVTGLTDGARRFTVTATDRAGNVDVAPAIHQWTIDTSAPDTQLDSGPSGVVTSTAATLTFSSPDAGAGATFECALDGAAFAACTSPRALTGLGQGAHAFEVRVRDVTGNLDPSPARRQWTVDTIAPTVTIDAVASPNADSTPTFTFAVAGGATAVQCRIDAGAFAACTSPYTPVAALADGDHTLEVRATDVAGNAGAATRAVTIDTVAPVVTIAAVPSPTGDSTPTFTFTVAGGAITMQCRIDAAAFAACASPFTPAALADGDHTLEVRATDAAGNTGTATRAVAVDTSGPTVTIAPPSSPTNDTTPTITFTTGGSPTVVQCRFDAGALVACASPYTPATALTEGAHTFEVRVADAAGNNGSATAPVTIDVTAPTVAITPVPTTNDTTPTITFATGGAPTVVQCRFDGGTYVACASPYTPATALTEGAHTFEVRVADAAGNSGSATAPVTIDVTAPTVAITPVPTTNDTTPTITFATGGAPTVVQCRFDGGTYVACASPYTPAAALAEGAHTFQVYVADAAGNNGSATAPVAIDVTAPTVDILQGVPENGVINGHYTEVFFQTGGGPTLIECRVDQTAFGACGSPTAYATPFMADGSHFVQIHVRDAAGNEAYATRGFGVDTTPPTLWLTSWPTTTLYYVAAHYEWSTGETPVGTECTVERVGAPVGAYYPCGSPWDQQQPAWGGTNAQFRFHVRVRDAAGNWAEVFHDFAAGHIN